MSSTFPPLRTGNPGFSNVDISDIICILYPYSVSAVEEVRRLASEGSPHIISEVNTDRIRLDLGLEGHIGGLESSLSGQSNDAIILRLSSHLKTPGAGYKFGRNTARCDIVFANDPLKRISNIHFRVCVNSYGNVIIEDQSTNGTFVDRHLLNSRHEGIHRQSISRWVLSSGSIIKVFLNQEIQDLVFRVYFPNRDKQQDQAYITKVGEYFTRHGVNRDSSIADSARQRRLSLSGSSVASSVPDSASLFENTSSLGSADTDLTGLQESAVEEISNLLLQQNLHELLEQAISIVGPEGFEINFSLLLRRYGMNLKTEASDYLESQAARLILACGTRIAECVRRAIPSTATKERSRSEIMRDKERGSNDLNEWLSSALAEPNQSEKPRDVHIVSLAELDSWEGETFHRLESIKSFLVSSQAYQKFNDDTRIWLNVSSPQTVLMAEEEAGPRKNEEDQALGASEILKFDRIGHADGVLENTSPRLLETRCGKRLNLEVPEDRLQGAMQFAESAGPPHSRTISISGSGSGTSTSLSVSHSSLSQNDSISPNSNDPSNPPSTILLAGNDPQHPVNKLGTERYLLLCVNSGRNRTMIRNVDLTTVGHDEVLFQNIRTAYYEMRGIQSRNPFIVPTTIQYIKFELMSRYKSGDCVGNIEPDSIPPISEVYNGAYAYRPCPPDIGRYPVHPQVFMHSFFEPGDHTGSVAVQRLPKKMHRKLNCNVSPQGAHEENPLVPVGWGVYFVEGFNWGLLRLCSGVAVVLTLLLTLVWSNVMDDVQGGTGIGQYSAALVVMTLTIVMLESAAR